LKLDCAALVRFHLCIFACACVCVRTCVRARACVF